MRGGKAADLFKAPLPGRARTTIAIVKSPILMRRVIHMGSSRRQGVPRTIGRMAESKAMILYLHGFTSGPQSHKAQALRARMDERGIGGALVSPQLPAGPADAIRLAASIAETLPVTALVGSSLGGYYATWLAEQLDLRAVLVNPAVMAHISLERYIGRQQWLYSGDHFDFTQRHIEELRSIEVPLPANPKRFWLMVEEGDETLDYRQAVARYAGARQTVLPGGNHSFSRWGEYLDAVIDFCLGVPVRRPLT